MTSDKPLVLQDKKDRRSVYWWKLALLIGLSLSFGFFTRLMQRGTCQENILTLPLTPDAWKTDADDLTAVPAYSRHIRWSGKEPIKQVCVPWEEASLVIFKVRGKVRALYKALELPLEPLRHPQLRLSHHSSFKSGERISLGYTKGGCFKWPYGYRKKPHDEVWMLVAEGAIMASRWKKGPIDSTVPYTEQFIEISSQMGSPRPPKLLLHRPYPMKHMGLCAAHAAYHFRVGKHPQTPTGWAPVLVELLDPKNDRPLVPPWITDEPAISTLSPIARHTYLKLHQEVKVRLSRIDALGRRSSPQSFKLTLSPTLRWRERMLFDQIKPFTSYSIVSIFVMALICVGLGLLRGLRS